MFEKIVIALLKSMSAVVYVIIMLTLFSVPVIFIYQAVKPPVFTVLEVIKAEIEEDDEFLLSEGQSSEDFIRIDYTMTASSGKFSPYSYEISEFTVEENEFTEKAGTILVTIDEPLSFSNTENDDFILSVYIEKEYASELSGIASSLSFKAVNYEKSFSEFSLEHK